MKGAASCITGTRITISDKYALSGNGNLVVIGTDYTGSYKFNYHTITTTKAPRYNLDTKNNNISTIFKKKRLNIIEPQGLESIS